MVKRQALWQSPLPMNALLLLGLCAATATAAVPPLADHRLLVTSVRTGDTEIFLADPATGDLLNLSRSPGSEDRYPCWSPDGKRIAFVSDRAQAANLYVMDADGSHVRRLTTSKAICYQPSWQKTPKGDRIVFGVHDERPEVASVRPDGSDFRILGDGQDPTLSPDGRRICYTGVLQEGGVSVFVMQWDGTAKRRILAGASKPDAIAPNWSPDGKQIVFSWPIGDALELFVINASGSGDVRQVTHTGGMCTPATWSPDGQWIAFRFSDEAYWRDKDRMREVFAAKPPDKRAVWIVRPDGTDAQALEALRFQMSLDGSRASWKPLAANAQPKHP